MKYVLNITVLIFCFANLYGQEWELIGFEGKTVNCIAISPIENNVFFVGVMNEGLYKSIDTGKTWFLVYPSTPAINCITIDYKDSSRMFLGTDDGLILSPNRAVDFFKVPLENDIKINCIVLDETQTRAIILGTSKGIYKSFDNCSTFLKAGLNNFAISCLAIDNSRTKAIIYVGTLNSGFFKTANYGISWSPINNGLDNLNAVNILSNDVTPNNLSLSTHRGTVFLSSNSGDIWRRIELSSNADGQTYLIHSNGPFHNQNDIFAINSNGEIFKLSDSLRSEKISNKPVGYNCLCIGISNLKHHYLLIGTSSGLFRFYI